MRVILDSNVLVSASIAPQGIPGALVEAWIAGRLELIVSPELLAEVRDVLGRERFRRWLSEAEAEAFVTWLRLGATVVEDPACRPAVTRDPDDDYLLALGHDSGADALVSGDRDLLDLAEPPLAVLTPRALLERIDPPATSKRP